MVRVERPLPSKDMTTLENRPHTALPPGQVIAHTNLYWQYQSAPGRVARAIPAVNVTWKRVIASSHGWVYTVFQSCSLAVHRRRNKIGERQ